MVNASNPRLMNRVVDAVVHLCEGKGSTARDVLDFLRQTSKTSSRNLTMQVRRALKHAVNAGLLRHRSGRYKALFTLNPAPAKQSENQSSDEKSADVKNAFDIKQPKVTSDATEENRKKHKRQRRERRQKRSSSRHAKRKRRSRSRRRDQIGDVRKSRFHEHEDKAHSPRQMVSSNKMRVDIGHASCSSNRQKRRATPRDRSYYHHLSDCSDDEDRKTKVRRKSLTRQDYKPDGTVILKRRSASRNRSPQRQKSQQLQVKQSFEEDENAKLESDICGNNEDQDIDKDLLDSSRNGSAS